MMKYLMIMMFLFILINLINKNLIQMYIQLINFIGVFLFLFEIPLNGLNYWMKIYYILGCDYISMGLILLSGWIMSLMIMSSLNDMKISVLYYFNLMNFLMIFLLLSFMSINMFWFYFFFESGLIPVFMLILGWGNQINRVQAGFYMMLYTMVGSLPLLYFIIMIYNYINSLMFNMVILNITNLYFYAIMNIAFLIKMPMYMFHLWLPKAHVEAPLTGSMVLAGVMLKLGSYGLMRFMLMMMNMCINYNKFLIVMSLIGGIYSSFVCLCEIDMKKLVAYSSVVHMSILMSGLLTMMNWGWLGSMLMMIAHGLCSSGMFYLVNLNYERLSSRSLIIVKGMINYLPSLSLIWFLMCSSNLAFPPSLNLFSEILLINSLILWDKYMLLLIMLILFMSAMYSLYLFSYSQHGSFNKLMYFIKGVMMIDFMILLMHWVPLNMIFIIMFIYL